MQFDNIDYAEADGIAEIVICRPEKKNAMTAAMFRDLRICWDAFAAGEARVAILRSVSDDVFSAGADLTDPPEHFWQGVPELGFTCDKPIIAALSGKVIGAAVALSSMCDLCVMTEDTQLIYPEAKIGVAKGAITALARRMPLRPALELMLMGEPMPAARAYEIGFANRVVPNGTHVDAARVMAARIATNAPLVVKMLKRMTLEALGDVAVQTHYATLSQIDRVMGSEDAANALAAFREKRKPVFEGR